MRRLPVIALTAALAAGCGPSKPFDGPTVDAFVGQIAAGGKPVSFPPDRYVTLKLIHQKSAQSFEIPIQPDGTYKIGWMPIGDYSGQLIVIGKDPKQGNRTHNLPGKFEITEGKTQYTVELGDKWKL